MAKTPSANPFDHAQALVVRFDPDRHIAALFAPADRRAYLYAVAAFALELGGIRAAVKEALPGEVRLQWWRDVLGGEREEEGWGHPVGAALLKTIADCRLPRQALLDMIDARVFDLYDDPMPTGRRWRATAARRNRACSGWARSSWREARTPARRRRPAMPASPGRSRGCCGPSPGMRGADRSICRPPLLSAVGLDREGLMSGQDGEGLRAALGEARRRAREHTGEGPVAQRHDRTRDRPSVPAARHGRALPRAHGGAEVQALRDARGRHQRPARLGDVARLVREGVRPNPARP